MNSRSAMIALLVFEVLGLCLCAVLIASIGLGFWDNQSRLIAALRSATPTRSLPTATPFVTVRASATPVATSSPAATNPTRSAGGAQTPIVFITATRTGTPSPSAYHLVVPTPTAPRIIYPVTYQSNFAVVTYTVTGKTLEEISRSLDANALPDPHEPNSRYYARTNWQLLANWNWSGNSGRCELDRAAVTIVVTITLPALTMTTGVPADVLKRWNTFIQNTQTHEVGHARLAQQGARDYQRDLGNYPSSPDCTTMASKLKNLYEQEFAAIEKMNIDYDKQTQHGVTQGAVFP